MLSATPIGCPRPVTLLDLRRSPRKAAHHGAARRVVAVAGGVARPLAVAVAVTGLLLLAVVLTAARAVWDWLRPWLLRAGIIARDWALRHAKVREVTLALMVLSYPIARESESAGLIPDHHATDVAAALFGICGLVLWWAQVRGRRKWRERGGRVLVSQKASEEDHGKEIAELRAAQREMEIRMSAMTATLERMCDQAGVEVPSCERALRAVASGPRRLAVGAVAAILPPG